MRSESDSIRETDREEQSGNRFIRSSGVSVPQWREVKAKPSKDISGMFLPLIHQVTRLIDQTIKEGESNVRKNKV